MNQKNKNKGAFFLAGLTIVSICTLIFWKMFFLVEKIPQVFNDIIIENVARQGLNKTLELNLFWCLLFVGIVLFLPAFLLFKKLGSLLNFHHFAPKKFNTTKAFGGFSPYLCLFLIPNIFSLIAWKKINISLVFLLVFSFVVYLFFKDHTKQVLVFTIILFFAVIALFTFISLFTEKGNVSNQVLWLLTLCSVVLCLILTKWTSITFIENATVFLQILLPFLLTIYFISKYNYKGSVINLPFSLGYYGFFLALFIICLGVNVHHGIKYFKGKATQILSTVTPILIFIYNSYSATGMFAQPDQHHHGEQMIPFQQVFSLSQELYKEYSPVSGLFPFVNGFIQNVLLDGTISEYPASISILMVLVCILTMYLIVRHVGVKFGLIFAIFYSLPSYNRPYLLLPALLLLTLPNLVKNRNRWFMTWVFTCFLCGLYYPLFGGALLLATIPLGFYQLSQFIKAKEYMPLVKKPSFYINWLVCLLPILLSIPLLLNMVKLTLAFSSQTILADGIALYGQNVPTNFLSYISNQPLRNFLYFAIRFMLPMVGIWMFAFTILYLGYYLKKDKAKREERILTLLFLLAGGVSLGISYTYTLVRADVNMVLSRTSYVLVSIGGIYFGILLLTRLKPYMKPSLNWIALCICFSFPLFIYQNISDIKVPQMWIYPNGNASLVLDFEDKLFTYYEVPDTFLPSNELPFDETVLSQIGKGFMIEDQVHYVMDYEKVINQCNAVSNDISYLGFDGQGFYYYNNVKACGTGFIQAAKSYESQQTILDQVKEKRPVVFLLEPESSYYIYYYILTNDYVYKDEDHAFYPAELYSLLFDDSVDNLGTDYGASNTLDLGKVSSSFGMSYQSLASLFTENEPLAYDMQSTKKQLIDGSTYDFLHLELNEDFSKSMLTPETEVVITFTYESNGVELQGTVSSQNNSTEYLIPMGMNPSWLLNDITDLAITFIYEDTFIDTSNYHGEFIKKCELLSIRK